jgi:hypothetical protein
MNLSNMPQQHSASTNSSLRQHDTASVREEQVRKAEIELTPGFILCHDFGMQTSKGGLWHPAAGSRSAWRSPLIRFTSNGVKNEDN